MGKFVSEIVHHDLNNKQGKGTDDHILPLGI